MDETLAILETPIPVVDLDRMDANIGRTAAYARQHGLALRPHVKTHKSPYVGALQMAAGAAGLTCATPREAEVMRAASDNLLFAYPPVGEKRAHRIAELARDATIRVMLDSPESVEQLGRSVDRFRSEIGVLVELDVGMGRVGVGTPAAAVDLARRIERTQGLRYVGVGFYPGHIRVPSVEQDPLLAAVNERLDEYLGALAAAGLPPQVVSGGSTPTLWRTHEYHGVNEMRPGTSVYNDRTTAAIGVSALGDCALTVLATVVSTSVSGRAIIDAGLKALGREPLRGPGDGYGALLDTPDAKVVALSEEHGTIDLATTTWRPRVGDRVRVIPNHACIVTHLFDAAAGVRDGVVERTWPIAARGR